MKTGGTRNILLQSFGLSAHNFSAAIIQQQFSPSITYLWVPFAISMQKQLNLATETCNKLLHSHVYCSCNVTVAYGLAGAYTVESTHAVC